MYMQFMLPAGYINQEPSIGQVFVESFLNVVKEKGIEAATKSFEESTSTWMDGKKLSPKGLVVSNDSAYAKWVPFGPAIRGTYDDYGNIKPAEDEDSQRRVKILEGLMGGLPFSTIMDVAQDDRWYTLGLGKYGDTEDKTWKPEGITKDMPEWLLELCLKLSLTYFHAAVYDTLRQPDFSSEERDGIMKGKYEIKWKKEYLDPIKKKFPAVLDGLKDIKNADGSESEDFTKKLEKKWKQREVLQSIGVFRCLSNKLGLIYQACMAREGGDLDWFYESLNFMYSLSGMCVTLDQSEYGSQHLNFFGWKRVYAALNPKLEETLTKYGYYEEEQEDEE
jgi:hypothetical protein